MSIYLSLSTLFAKLDSNLPVLIPSLICCFFRLLKVCFYQYMSCSRWNLFINAAKRSHAAHSIFLHHHDSQTRCLFRFCGVHCFDCRKFKPEISMTPSSHSHHSYFQQNRGTLSFPYQVIANGSFDALSKTYLKDFDCEIITVLGFSDRDGFVCMCCRFSVKFDCFVSRW